MEELDPERTKGQVGLDTETWTVRRALYALPEKYRGVLVLQAVGGYSGAEIAAFLEILRATVNTRLFRARSRLRKALDGAVKDTPALPSRSVKGSASR